jgi:phthalate 4,5-dioxygenase oxygenase subunit
MLTEEQNQALTRTGPGTPMGDAFRCYWMPALLSRELSVDGPPMRIKLLGEDFIAFRDSESRVGIVEPRCPHRGANLFFGRNEECGLRCAYHGWKFDVNGQCIETPTVPAEIASSLQDKASVRALQVAEWGDCIWAWFGEGVAPAPPQFEFATLPPEHRFVSKKLQQCNWAQAAEGGIDTAHFSYLHAGMRDGQKVALHEVDGPWRPDAEGENEPAQLASLRWMIEDGAPRFSVVEHAAGFIVGAARSAPEDQTYWRCTQFLMPNHSCAPGNFPGANQLANSWVPIDDESCWIFCYAWNPEREISPRERERFAAGGGIFAEVDDEYHPIRNRENDYLMDRTAQKESSFTGIAGISEQDQAIADSQGLIADRTRELLGQTDVAVVRFRQMLLGATEAVAAGNLPHGADTPEAYCVRSGDTVAPRDSDIMEVLQGRFGEAWGIAV